MILRALAFLGILLPASDSPEDQISYVAARVEISRPKHRARSWQAELKPMKVLTRGHEAFLSLATSSSPCPLI